MLLCTHSYFSHGYGTIPTKRLIELVAQAGYPCIALTDINNTCTMLDFYRLCVEPGIRPVMGVDFRNLSENAQICYLALARNATGLAQINEHLSEHLHKQADFAHLAPDVLRGNENVVVIYPYRNAYSFRDLRSNEYVGMAPHQLRQCLLLDNELLSRKAVALPQVNLETEEDFYLHCLIRCVQLNTVLGRLKPHMAGRRDDVLPTPRQMTEWYKHHPHMLFNAQAILDSCELTFDMSRRKNLLHFTDSLANDRELLNIQCREGMMWRYGNDHKEAQLRIEKEMKVVETKDFIAYFLTAWDIVREAQSRGFMHAGRGSGANSIIAYCLGITDVDPIALNLYFERFLNLHRNSPPDFDIDFSWKDREAMTQYIFGKYGHERTALLGAHVTYQFRAAVRELGKVYGLPKDDIDRLISSSEIDKLTKSNNTQRLLDKYALKILKHSRRLVKFPHVLSIHSSGILIGQDPIFSYTATSLPPKGFPTVHMDMYTADHFHIHKLDVLSQRGLGHIKDCVELIRSNRGEEVDIFDIPKLTEDPVMADKMARGDTIGCFYIESPAMRQLMRKLRCSDFNTLVAASSIIRPGVSSSGMMGEFIERERNPERRLRVDHYLYNILGDTHGIMVYQEDVIKVAHLFADFDLAEADLLRRAMAWKFRVDNGFDKLEEKFFNNCRQKKYPEDVISEVWRQMMGFAGFSFCKAHSASYAVESYQSLYLKTYYPLEFMVGVINNFGGFYSTAFYINEARKHAAAILPPCLNNSEMLTTLHGAVVYLGFILMKGLEEIFVHNILHHRTEAGPYTSLSDFIMRMQPPLSQLLLLIKIGAFNFTGVSKRQLLWEAYITLKGRPTPSPPGMKALFGETDMNSGLATLTLPQMPQNTRQDALEQIELLGFPLCRWHDLLTESIQGELLAADLVNNRNQIVTMVGYVYTTRMVKTVRKEYMQFISLLDEEGGNFEAVLFPPIYLKYAVHMKGMYKVRGVVKEQYDVCVLEVTHLEILPISFQGLTLPTSDSRPQLQGNAAYYVRL